MRCTLATVLAPVYVLTSWVDAGVFLVFPMWSQDTYWKDYWKAKHKEMDDYGKKPICKAGVGGQHTMIPGKVPDAAETTFKKFATWIGGY